MVRAMSQKSTEASSSTTATLVDILNLSAAAAA